MNECYSDYFVHNGLIESKNSFKLPKNSELTIYEVIRVINRTPLFLHDHIERLLNSISINNVDQKIKITLPSIEKNITMLLENNFYIDGNFKYSIHYINEHVHSFVYYIFHNYPSLELIEKGISLDLINAVRIDPNMKIVHNNLKHQVENILKNNDLYEVLLIDNYNNITEGSKSNVFFIKDNTLYTSPDESVLKGITRKYIIKLANDLKIPLIFSYINAENLGIYEAAFLTGTSPKILPIRNIGKYNFNTKHSTINTLINAYNLLINNYINQNKINV
jgi:branched-chain amino acid aminotransferase